MISRDRATTLAMTLAVLAAVAALVAMPLIRLAQLVVDGGWATVGRVARAPGVVTAVAHTAELAVLVPVLAVPLGSGLALLLHRPDVPARGPLRVLVVLPLLVPQFVLGYSWTQAYGRAGFTDQLAGVRWTTLFGPIGVVAVLVVDAVPICFLLTSAGLATRAQPELESAARTAGAGWWVTVRTIVLPLLRPVLTAEVVLVFVATLESFAVPQVLGTPAGYETVTTRIYSDVSLGSDPATFTDAMTLSLALIVVVAVLLVPADVLLAPRLRSWRAPSLGDRPTGGRPTLRGSLIAVGVGCYSALVVLLPTAALVLASVTRAIGLPPTPGNWTLGNFRAALDEPTLAAIGNSVELAALAAVVLTVLGAAVAALHRSRSAQLLGTAAALPFAVPGSALAVGLLIAYDRWIGGTLAIILLAYLAKFWAMAHRAIAGAADRLLVSEWQAARTSGAGPVTAVRSVWLPALAPALAGAWLLVFVAALHEVTMSSLLYSTGNETLAVAVLNSQQLGTTSITAALSVVLTGLLVIGAVPAWFMLRLVRRRRAAPALRISAAEVVGA